MSEKKNISILEPVEGSSGLTLLAPTTLRFYRSSQQGFVSVCMFPADEPHNYVSAGTRLTDEQVIQLHNDLTKYVGGLWRLDETDAYDVGFQNGLVAAREAIA